MGKDKQRVAELEKQLEDATETNTRLEQTRAKEKSLLQASIEKERLETAQAVEAKASAEEALSALTYEQDAIISERDSALADNASLKTEVESMKAEVQTALSEKDEAKAKMKKAILTMEGEKAHRKQMEKEHGEMKKRLKAMNDKVEKTEHVDKSYSTELTAAVNRIAELEAKLSQAQENNDSATTSFRTEISAVEEKARNADTTISQVKSDADAEISTLKSNVLELEEALDDANGRIKGLEEEVQLLTVVGEASDPLVFLKESVLELKADVFTKSQELVNQAEKHLNISTKLATLKDESSAMKDSIRSSRELLLRGIAGPEVDESLYQHIGLDELVRLRIKTLENEMINAGRILYQEKDGDNVQKEGAEVLGSIGKLEREMRILRSRNKRLQSRVEELEEELQSAVGVMEDVRALKGKTAELAGRQRNEKGLRAKADFAAKQYGEQVVALSEHIEKLMVHLKHEAAAKARALDGQKRAEKEVGVLRNRVVSLGSKSKAKDKIVAELQEGSKILEEQLRLLDEKQIDLRTKLDWSRSSSQKEIKRLQEEAGIFRMKWHMAVDSGQVKDFELPKKGKKGGKKGRGKTNNSITSEDRRQEEEEAHNAFQIPRLPENGDEGDTPWSDAKLTTLKSIN